MGGGGVHSLYGSKIASLNRVKVTSHLTIAMRGQRERGKIQRNNYHQGDCGPS